MKKIAYEDYQSTDKNQLPDYFTEELLAHASIFTFQKNERIQIEGRPLDYLFYIIEGKVKILKTQANGRQMILQFLSAGDFIGELTVVQAETETKDVVARGQTICLGIPIHHATSLQNNIAFLQTISQYIGKKLLLRMEHLTENQTYPLAYRLVDLLLTVAVSDRYEEKQTEIAEYLGVSYRHLLYTMKQLKEAGFIEKDTSGYRIHRQKLLAYRQTFER
ncbi:transcriptional regulator YeiL [Enterococcus saccharolyticus]|uniref:Cyclic nucleotide-binding protein n=1 Tax=Candidatus Enterococcus willemsii TaxID=1857215 RepID=A0ABQ6YXA0_9ENTE|nr:MULTISPECIES: transcriptional regulator YeiL [Enterococcus]KAF1302442.1 cyclic nucleotide-binding protein [Enterococcus sp. CU12B]MCD5002624.1 transcriptional regulator YeiL [Enterococcus saccharolyticus]